MLLYIIIKFQSSIFYFIYDYSLIFYNKVYFLKSMLIVANFKNNMCEFIYYKIFLSKLL